MRPRPLLSVIVPAHQAQPILRRCLDGLAASDLSRERWELIVVDDASTDETSLVAAEYADTVVRLAGKPHGPAFARNRGYEASRGEILVFVDADVIVHRDALSRLAAAMEGLTEPASVFGSYDDRPEAQTLVSQYRNLLHHFVHQQNAGPAETFWAGLGAIRADVFAELGMFDEWTYARPQIEDIELGRRLRRAGHQVVLDPAIQGTHLKHWTLKGTLTADFQYRGVPWMWLIIQEGTPESAHALNVRFRERLCTVLVFAGVVFPVLGLIFGERWPLITGGAALAAAIAMNLRFYLFLARIRGVMFAAAAVPLHLLFYYFLNTFSAATGWLVHHLFGEPAPPAHVSAHAQLGVRTWPPAPRRPTSGVWAVPSERRHEEPDP
jgi:glycosyltransferase involved in cell wall biosynthesis